MKSLLRNAREQKGLKTREVAQILGIDQALISKFESGARKPTKEQIIKLSRLLQIDYETLIVSWLKEKILYEIGNEEFALKALLQAEEELQNTTKSSGLLLTEIQNQINEIDTLKAKMDTLNHFELRRINIFLDLDFITEFNKVTGYSLTFEETKAVINEGLTIPNKSMQEHLAAVNLQEALEYIKDLSNKKVTINDKDLLQLHQIALRGISANTNGVYKKDTVTISEMKLFFNWYETNKNHLHPILLAAEAHLKLMTIQPFDHGNVQIAILIMNWILLKSNYIPATIRGDEESINAYVIALEKSQSSQDPQPLIQHILNLEKLNLSKAFNTL